MNVRTAELVLGHVLPERALDQRRSAGEERSLRRHHGEVAEHGSGGDSASGGAGDAKDKRHFLSRADVRAEHVEAAGQMLVPITFGSDIGAGALVEDEQRHSVLASHVGQEEALESFLRADVGGATRDREVLTADHDRSTIDLGQSTDVRQRLEVSELPILVRAISGETADLVETARIDQRVDAIANRQLAQFTLPIDAFLAAHLERQPATQVQFVDFRLPVGWFSHSASSSSHRST